MAYYEHHPYESMDKPTDSLNVPLELGAFVLRVVVSLVVVHHGLQKFSNPEGFTQNIVSQYFSFLPLQPIYWTYAAATTEIVGPILLSLGIFARTAALGLMVTMGFA